MNRKRNYWESVALVGTQVADALEYAHKQGIHHRDIKPSNLLLDNQGTVWVADFGLAKADDQQNLTHTGDILGTLRYMPPEAFEGKTDARSDVYSLGLTLYEMVAFRPAFDQHERNRLIRQVMNEEPPRLDRLSPRLPRDLVTIVHKAIERDPQRRYATAGVLADRSGSWRTSRSSPGGRPRRSAILALAAAQPGRGRPGSGADRGAGPLHRGFAHRGRPHVDAGPKRGQGSRRRARLARPRSSRRIRKRRNANGRNWPGTPRKTPRTKRPSSGTCCGPSGTKPGETSTSPK